MKKKKVELKSLKVKSFVTKEEAIKGGGFLSLFGNTCNHTCDNTCQGCSVSCGGSCTCQSLCFCETDSPCRTVGETVCDCL